MATSKRLARDLENFDLARRSYHRKLRTYAAGSYYHIPGFTSEDMEQELYDVLWKAVQSYDPAKAASFNTYVQTGWRNRIGTLRRAQNQKKRTGEVISLDSVALSEILGDRYLKSAEDTAVDRETLREEWELLPDRVRRRIAG